VESPTGTFNVVVNAFGPGPIPTLTLLTASDPSLEDGLMYLWPVLVAADTTPDYVYGWLPGILGGGEQWNREPV
jgi:hypothetical protein